MKAPSLLEYKKNIFSQNGEDGIIEMLCKTIGVSDGTCLEVGAGDGALFSNTRALILRGWRALMIEADDVRFAALSERYRNEAGRVVCVHAKIDGEKETLDALAKRNGFSDFDLISIDINGFDNEIFESLAMRPKIIVIEINAGHSPKSAKIFPRNIAQNNVGQPFPVFAGIADRLGYALVCYTGNAFYVRKDIARDFNLAVMSDEGAYRDFLEFLSSAERAWLYLVNKGLVPPYFSYGNSFLSAEALRLSRISIAWGIIRNAHYILRGFFQ